jgi:hypothetical protein
VQNELLSYRVSSGYDLESVEEVENELLTYRVSSGYDLDRVEEVKGLYLAEDSAGQQGLRELQGHLRLTYRTSPV